MKEKDSFRNNICQETAKSFQKLASLRGVSSLIEWRDGQYYANNQPCGVSVGGLYEWLNNVPGVKP